ncbi:MAG: DNA-binding response regulator, partial [Burkholderiales bacterium]|nr:DNA-binding response regulator [Burkholderiales bacterium]
MRILVVEDDPMIGKTLVTALQQDGYTVDWVKDGQAGKLALDT